MIINSCKHFFSLFFYECCEFRHTLQKVFCVLYSREVCDFECSPCLWESLNHSFKTLIHSRTKSVDCLCERVIESLTQPIRSKHWFTQEVNAAACCQYFLKNVSYYSILTSWLLNWCVKNNFTFADMLSMLLLVNSSHRKMIWFVCINIARMCEASGVITSRYFSLQKQSVILLDTAN